MRKQAQIKQKCANKSTFSLKDLRILRIKTNFAT